MDLHRISMYKTAMVMVLVVLLLTVFCLCNVEPGSGPYYLCLFTLIVDLPFLGFLVYMLIRDLRRLKKEAQEPEKNP